MKHASWILAVILIALSGLAAAQLNSGARIAADVPFEFVVANKIVPAGECVVQRATMDGHTLAIVNSGAKVNLFASAWLDEHRKAADSYAMVFSKYGNQYFLTGIKLQGSKITYRLPQSRAEAELRAQNVPMTEEILLASAK